jgi:endonuclease-8
MPEGDTVWLAARRMHEALAGPPLVGSDLRVPQLATTDLSGRDVLEVVARGKHLLTRIAGGLTLHTHFAMEGSWHLYRPGTAWSGGPAWQVRAVLVTDEWQAVGYRLVVVELVETAREADAVGHLGPDLLGPDWDQVEALRRLAAAPGREIGTALLDQRNLAGIGNLYKTEALFLQGISPWTTVGAVPDLTRLVRRARRLLMTNRERWEQTTTGNLRRGEQHWVFERSGLPCRRCGTPILEAMQGDAGYQRICYWCPYCQVGPAPTGTTRARRRGGSPAGRSRSPATRRS